MKQLNNDNAANRTSYVGNVYNIGEKKFKDDILNSLPERWAKAHREGYIHIHDLDAYGLTYNCLAFNLVNHFPIEEFESIKSDSGRIIHLFELIKGLFTKIGNEQSGGMAFANFDNEMADMLYKLDIKLTDFNKELIKSLMRELILWCNGNHTRMGQTSYYITFNIGLAKSDLSRFIAYTLLDEFGNSNDLVFKPNIVFKVKSGINFERDTPNYKLLEKSLAVTAKKMIPTYILCDSNTNKNIDPEKLAIMGCRSRIVQDEFGCEGAVGRGNIANISINLPKIALEIDKEFRDKDVDYKVEHFQKTWDIIAGFTKSILIDRYKKLCELKKEDFPTNLETQLWCESFDRENLEDVFKHGTLSIGFIGLGEAVEVLTGHKYYSNIQSYMYALGIVKHMRDYVDFLRNEWHLNFSLLATAGELISGRFIDIDKKLYKPEVDIFSKGFYTNSFHIDVDSKLPGYKKIQMEGLFHEYCNGGCITYIELGEAPLANIEGLLEYLHIATEAGTHYLGFNFPKDVCNECNTSGVFDTCPKCKSNNITRIRRVSGYLEILDGFTKGKKNEVKARRAN